MVKPLARLWVVIIARPSTSSKVHTASVTIRFLRFLRPEGSDEALHPGHNSGLSETKLLPQLLDHPFRIGAGGSFPRDIGAAHRLTDLDLCNLLTDRNR